MSWVNTHCVSFFQMLCIKVVKTGRTPQHVAFIMDGNRRYARKCDVQRSLGHYKGFEKLAETLRWCLDLNIREVTVYAFSIENFKRTEEEVSGLMELAKEKFENLLGNIDQINEWGIQVKIAGRLTLLSKDLQVLLSKVMLATKDNNKLRLNIAYSYTGRDEISRTASDIVEGVRNKELLSEDVDSDLVTCSMELGEPDLLIRTSGESRLSDFMLWQISNTMLYFTDVLWPEFSLWNFLAAVLHYQRYAPVRPSDIKYCHNERKQLFLNNLERRRIENLERIVGC